jgi:hypothetical protein
VSVRHSPFVADLLLNESHWEQRCQVLASDGLHRFWVQRGRRWAGQVGDDVVPAAAAAAAAAAANITGSEARVVIIVQVQ